MLLLVTHYTMLRRTGRLFRAGGRRFKRGIWASLQDDRVALTKQVGKCIEVKLAEGDVQEAFWHLKGWYHAATEVKARPCFQMMERQMAEQVALYTRRPPPGEPLPINIAPISILDGAPTNSEVQDSARNLSNGRSSGVL
jgi:hypothetical protein